MRKVAVIGAGITGLAAAHRLLERRAAGDPVEVMVYEAKERPGGVIVTDRSQQVPLEGGPDSLLTRKPAAVRLATDLGLADQLIPTHPQARGADIYWNGRLHPIPAGLLAGVPGKFAPLLRSPLLGPGAKVRLLADVFLPRLRRKGSDVSLGRLLEHHFGAALVDRVAAPMLSGIYAGDIRQLSARAAYPQVLEWEAQYRSLIRAVASLPAPPPGPRPPVFMTLASGLETLPDELARRLGDRLRLGVVVRALEPDAGGYRVMTDVDRERYDGVIVATPAAAAAELVEGLEPAAAALLKTIPYARLAVVGLVFDPSAIRLPAGKTGFLVPAGQALAMTAATYVSQKWQYPAPLPYWPLRVFYGRSGDEAAVNQDDAALIGRALSELKQVVDLRGDPRHVRVFRHTPGMPQYTVGHGERIQALQRLTGDAVPLKLAGAAYRGVGIPDCVRDGEAAAEAVLQALDLTRPA